MVLALLVTALVSLGLLVGCGDGGSGSTTDQTQVEAQGTEATGTDASGPSTGATAGGKQAAGNDGGEEAGSGGDVPTGSGGGSGSGSSAGQDSGSGSGPGGSGSSGSGSDSPTSYEGCLGDHDFTPPQEALAAAQKKADKRAKEAGRKGGAPPGSVEIPTKVQYANHQALAACAKLAPKPTGEEAKAAEAAQADQAADVVKIQDCYVGAIESGKTAAEATKSCGLGDSGSSGTSAGPAAGGPRSGGSGNGRSGAPGSRDDG